jgi:hypothetical protein
MNDASPLRVLTELCIAIMVFGAFWGLLGNTLKSHLDSYLKRKHRA